MLKWGISFGIQASFFLAILVAPALSAPAQKVLFEIRGKLLNPPGSPTCSFCQVQLEDQTGRSGTTLADGAGGFAFRNLEESFYRIRFKSTDYEDVSMTVKLNSEVTLVVIELEVRRSKTNTSRSGGQVVSLFTALEYQPKDVVVLYKKAPKNRLKSKFEEAALQYESISQTAPKFYAAHFDLGLSYLAIGRIDDAERQFQIARSLDSSTAEPLITGVASDPAFPPDGIKLLPTLAQNASLIERKLFWRYKANAQRAARDGDYKYLKILDNTFLFNVIEDPMERANLKERRKDIYNRIVAEWNASMLPEVDESGTDNFTGEQLADHIGTQKTSGKADNPPSSVNPR